MGQRFFYSDSLNCLICWPPIFRLNPGMFKIFIFKGSPYPSHFIFEINVGKRQIRHTTTLTLNDEFRDRLKIDWKFKFRIDICRIRLFPTLIWKIKWLGSELPLSLNCHFRGKITKMITRLNSWIFTNSPYIWFSRFSWK